MKRGMKIKYGFGEDLIFENNFMRIAKSSHKIKIPKNLDQDLAYLSGYHLGDGYLEDFNKSNKNRGKSSYEITYADKNIQQTNLINFIIKNKFAHELKIFKRPLVNSWIAKTNCKVLHWFLTKKLKLPMGYRNNIRIQKWIFSNKQFLSSFLSGFFDAEGDVGSFIIKGRNGKKYGKIRIQLTQKDKNFLLRVKSVLQDKYNIKSVIYKKSKQDTYVLKIDARNSVDLFREKIDFRNTVKKDKLRRLSKEIVYKQPRKIKI